MWFLRGFLSLVGRVMLCSIFVIAAAANKIPMFDECLADMESQGVPFAKVMLVGAIAFLIGGSLLIILGYKARLGAFLLIVFLGVTTYYYHDFWNAGPAYNDNQMLHFLKNLSLAGALVLIMANGSGAWSLDARDDETDENFL
jgi:putative oxidoreductase